MKTAINESEEKIVFKERKHVKLNPWASNELTKLCAFNQELYILKKAVPTD